MDRGMDDLDFGRDLGFSFVHRLGSLNACMTSTFGDPSGACDLDTSSGRWSTWTLAVRIPPCIF